MNFIDKLINENNGHVGKPSEETQEKLKRLFSYFEKSNMEILISYNTGYERDDLSLINFNSLFSFREYDVDIQGLDFLTLIEHIEEIYKIIKGE